MGSVLTSLFVFHSMGINYQFDTVFLQRGKVLGSLLSHVLLWGTMFRGFPSLEASPALPSGFGQVCGLNCVRIPKTEVLLKVLFNSAVLPVLINFRKENK